MKPLWNGFMKASHDGPRPSKIAISFEAMINMSSSDYSCIYSNMSSESGSAKKYGHDPVLTFVQPLHWKVMEIATHEQQINWYISNMHEFLWFNRLYYGWLWYSVFTGANLC